MKQYRMSGMAFRILVIALCITVITGLTGCGTNGSNGSLKYEKGSALDILDYTTIYYADTLSEKEAIKTLGSTKLSLDIDHSQEQMDVFNKRTTTSIKDLGGLNIIVDNVNYKLTISSDIDGKAKEVYNSIVNSLKNEKTKYLTLYRSLVLDRSGNILNIKFDTETNEIEFDFSRAGRVDTRFLDIEIRDREGITEEEVKTTGTEELRLRDSGTTESIEYVVFKSDAIYGIALTETGEELLDKTNTLNGHQLLVEESRNVYQGISLDSVISSISDTVKTHERTNKLGIETIKESENNGKNEVTLYFENEAINYKDDITRILESLDFSIQITDDYEMCDLVIGYTWLYSNSLQSTFNENVNEAIVNYHNNSEVESTVKFIVRSSWILGR